MKWSLRQKDEEMMRSIETGREMKKTSRSAFSNDALFALVDQHIFGFEPTCHGPCQYWFLRGPQDSYKCRECGAEIVSDDFRRILDQHPRRIPEYRLKHLLQTNLTYYLDFLVLPGSSCEVARVTVSPMNRPSRQPPRISGTVSVPCMLLLLVLNGKASSRGGIWQMCFP
ncbi:hypothetical protein EI42_05673 [Thermosporothrix hazakensis]|uniref:Uncharacterized protein n=2 Tax=Thermosporothrix hazakensis TaxID=644383 RepID=A0A326TWC4_THEHA|nr:hypothetical protein EI42_05673 [Thermosporothrix hazakensis]